MAGILEAQDIIVNDISNTLMRTYSVEKKMTVYNPSLNNYRSFVLIKLSKRCRKFDLSPYNSDKAIKQAQTSKQISKIFPRIRSQ